MADPTPTPPSAPAKTGTKSFFNQAQLAALSVADDVCAAAQKTDYAAALAPREIDPASVAQLVLDIKACRDLAASAAQSTTLKQSDTGGAHTAVDNLMTAIHEIQAAARQKYARTNPVMMHDYMVSQRINQNQNIVKQSVDSIIAKLGKDTLPGITPVKVASLQPLLDAYMSAIANPTGDHSAAIKLRAQRDAALQSINDRRATIQFAADAEWPFNVDANAGVRGEFDLPLHQPYHG
ncbi:MAG TPA: hypothetical protein VIK35_04215 [Verrucomicrobiae bacterium]